MEYPIHLYENIREEIAVSYIGHELRKIFPNIKQEDLNLIMERVGMRDFWNGVHGIGMGLKLHIGFIYLLTAENIVWSKEKLKTADLWFGVKRSDTKMIRDDRISAKELIDYFRKNETERMERLKNFDSRINFDDPIIAYTSNENGQEIVRVYEGNNRLYKAVLEGREFLDVYTGRYTTEKKEPRNYWLPTSMIMDYLYYVYDAIRNNDEESFNAQIKSLKYMLQFSEAGKYEFEHRALTSNSNVRGKILTAIGR